MNEDDILNQIAERAAIELEDDATGAQRLQSIQSEHKRFVAILREDMGLRDADALVRKLEKQAGV